MPQQPEPLVIDVDTGIDDAFALLYACAHDETQILGVSTVVGNVSLAAATRNTRAVLALARRADVPVWPGAATAISIAVRDASEIHGRTGLGHAILPEPDERADAVELHAADSIIAAARSHSGRLILCATGPLTNIALAVMREPDLPRLLKRFVIMGGAFSEPGNVTPSAEFNIWHDPEAARIVFRAFGGVGGAPVIAIGLDVTRKTIIDESDVAAIGARIADKPHGAKLTRFLEDASRFYFERMEKTLGKRIFTMHDPLAVAAALDPTLVETRRAAVDVETTGRLTTGATVVDWRGQWGRLANTEVAVAVDAARFRRLFLDAMARLADGGRL
jgi:purine nucleosidase